MIYILIRPIQTHFVRKERSNALEMNGPSPKKFILESETELAEIIPATSVVRKSEATFEVESASQLCQFHNIDISLVTCTCYIFRSYDQNFPTMKRMKIMILELIILMFTIFLIQTIFRSKKKDWKHSVMSYSNKSGCLSHQSIQLEEIFIILLIYITIKFWADLGNSPKATGKRAKID